MHCWDVNMKCLTQAGGAWGDWVRKDHSGGSTNCAATWHYLGGSLHWRMADIPGGASAPGRPVHASVREVQGCNGMAYKQPRSDRWPCPHRGNAETCFAQLAISHCRLAVLGSDWISWP